MPHPKRNVNPRRAPAPDMRAIRNAINARTHWILVTDSEGFANCFRALVAVLKAMGEGRGVALLEAALKLLDRADGRDVTLLTLPKSAFEPAHIAHFVQRMTGCDAGARREMLAGLNRGHDIIPLGSRPRELAVIVDRLRTGRVYAGDPSTN